MNKCSRKKVKKKKKENRNPVLDIRVFFFLFFSLEKVTTEEKMKHFLSKDLTKEKWIDAARRIELATPDVGGPIRHSPPHLLTLINEPGVRMKLSGIWRIKF